MPPSFLPPVFTSDPLGSPQLSYKELDLVRQESPEFLDFFDPFAPHKLGDVLDRCSELALEAVQTSDSGASVTSTSPLLTPDILCGLDHDDTSFGTDTTAEVDDSFINQISCFSDVSTGSAAASDNISANSSLSHPSTSNPKAAVGAPASFKRMSQSASIFSIPQNKIFARNSPLVLPSQPTEMEECVECTQLVTYCGRSINISGWEPSEVDKRPLAIVNLEDWMPPFPAEYANSRPFENEPESQMGLPSKDPVNLEGQVTEDPGATTISWARRFTSNRQLPESRKRRRIGASVPQVQDGGMQDVLSCMTTRPYAAGQDQPFLNGENTQAQNMCLDVDNMDFKFDVPSYVYPQPAVARAITRRAAEEDRRRAAETNMQMINQQTGNDEEVEEIERLVDEFLDIPDDMKDQNVGDGESIGSTFFKAFNPSRLPSPAPGSKSGGGRGLRQTRSLLDYSSSTRRRALARSRSDVDPRVSAPVAKNTLDNDDAFTQFGSIGTFQSGAEDLDTFPPMKRLLEEDTLMSSRSMKRTRVC